MFFIIHEDAGFCSHPRPYRRGVLAKLNIKFGNPDFYKTTYFLNIYLDKNGQFHIGLNSTTWKGELKSAENLYDGNNKEKVLESIKNALDNPWDQQKEDMEQIKATYEEINDKLLEEFRTILKSDDSAISTTIQFENLDKGEITGISEWFGFMYDSNSENEKHFNAVLRYSGNDFNNIKVSLDLTFVESEEKIMISEPASTFVQTLITELSI